MRNMERLPAGRRHSVERETAIMNEWELKPLSAARWHGVMQQVDPRLKI